ncbi:MAG: carbohydrate ABC transporter permease [Ruminococcaceae bacterium]|nr:carbohydrate ABC transporter permease [Oscillospiraceae bacterium]
MKNKLVMKEDRMTKIIAHSLLTILSACCLIPFMIILGSSFESQSQIMTTGYTIIPKSFTLDAYKAIFSNPTRLVDAYKITIITSIAMTLLGLFLQTTYGYVLSRRDYPYRKFLSFFAFFTMLFNGGLVPSYILISQWLGMKDSILALIIPGAAGAWYIMMLKSFFMDIPFELIESAKLDGAKEMFIYWKIVLPLSKPAIACIALFILFGSWNAWYPSLLYIEDESKVQLQYLLMSVMRNIEFLNSEEAVQLGVNSAQVSPPTLNARMAMCVLATGPIVMVFPFFQKYFVKGIAVGSVKG